MLPRTTRQPVLRTARSLPAYGLPTPGTASGRAISFSTLRVAEPGDLLTRPGGTPTPVVVADPYPAASAVARLVEPEPHGAYEALVTVAPRPPHPYGQVVCADDARCVCSLSGHITDAERAVLDGVCGQAARLATALAWILALAALAVLVLLMR